MRTGFVLRVAVLLGLSAVTAAAEPVAGPRAPEAREAMPVLAGASWMTADHANGRLLVLTGASAEEGPRLMVLSLDGKLKAEHSVPGGSGLDAAAVHYFPKGQTAAIVVYPGGGEPDSELGQGAEGLPAKVRLLDLGSGRWQAMPGLATAVAADPARNRLFLARGQNLRVIDAATGRLVLTRHFARNIEALTVSSNGRVHFLQSGFAGGIHGSSRILTLAPPSYTIASRKAVTSEEDGMALLAVDEKHGYALLAEEIGGGLDAELQLAVAAEPLDRQGQARLVSGPDAFAGELFGWYEGAPYLYLHDASAGELRIYDAVTLGPLQTIHGVHGEFLGYEPGGKVLVISGRRLERRDPQTFDVLQSVELGGPVQQAVVDTEAQRVYLVIEQHAEGRWTDGLQQLSLEELQPVL